MFRAERRRRLSNERLRRFVRFLLKYIWKNGNKRLTTVRRWAKIAMFATWGVLCLRRYNLHPTC